MAETDISLSLLCLDDLEKQKKDAENKMDEAARMMSINRKRINEINIIIRKKGDWGSKKPNVTDHAILRYLERVKGFNINKVKEEILTDNIKKAINLGANKVRTSNGDLIIKNKSIITIKV